ncbi:hypothetical protein [Microbulbifer pacificus]|uniref:Uncharacterized protein n=1 Tax=Microbulbifer pacificus TaxID=407164 RepID=A0AAU0N251_9GAMM|nr:hypothetical protein [Microbulbifer pacificus]WOX07057.1 hypothetical protein R5R33_07965 [Microbulbifer pacificus]
MNPIKTLAEKGWVIGLAFLLVLAATDTRAAVAAQQEGHACISFDTVVPAVGLAAF